MTAYFRFATLAVLLLAIALEAGAHTRSESYSHWHQTANTLTGVVTVPLREVMLLYQGDKLDLPPPEALQKALLETTFVAAPDSPCKHNGASILQAASGFVRVELRFDCEAEAATRITYRALFDVAPSHVHYAKLHRDGNFLAETLITDSADTWNIGALDATAVHSLGAFMLLGVEHIAGGVDHIAFLVGLLLIAGSLRRSIVAVTGFTLGHSVSLGAAVLGYVHADGALVEAFIGFTVAVVAVEYFVLRRHSGAALGGICLVIAWSAGLLAVVLGVIPGRALLAYTGFGIFALSYLLASDKLARNAAQHTGTLLFLATACFGLVHGFGFAGFLMETGLLGASLFVPLLGFNLGVEIGQLLLLAIALALTWVLRGRVPAATIPLLAAGLCGIGVFWFVGRTFA